MQRLLLSLLCLLTIVTCASPVVAQQRRPIDSEHPMWLIHVDVWNKADPQKIIDLIPADVRPYVVMNLSLSCGYDVARGVHKMPQNAIPTYKSWGSICQQNGMWFTCQPASGGHTHILDDDLETFEYFFKHYPNFLGWNFAEQFWGFNEPGDKYSSSDVNRIALFAKLVEMSHNYGGLLTISFCGNIWSHLLNPVGMMKRNADLLEACKKYPEAILWLYKYTTSSCFYNNESVCFGPFVAGLTTNYGVRYDNCGWNGATADLVGENKCKYPVAAGIGTVMEQTCQNGGAVWDGPELIWTEDFQNLSNSVDNYGYTHRNWGTFPGFDNAWIDMFRKVLDGTLYIPTRQEVVEKTKIIILNDVTTGNDEDKYAAWADLYDGLYKQTDPFNRNNGQWMDNYLYLKSTGRYGTIPITPDFGDDLGKNIPTKIKKSARKTVWSSQLAKTTAFNKAYPAISEGDLFVSRFHNQLITYTPYSYLNKKKTASAKVPLLYNTCERLDLKYGKLSSGAIHEYADSIKLYLNNYRTDTTTMVEDVITVVGATSEPSYKRSKRVKATAEHSAQWDAATGSYSLSVKHNGPVDIIIYCQGAGTDRLTDVTPHQALSLPKQPEEYFGPITKEAEDMDWKSIRSCVTDPFNAYPDIYGHAGNGFMDLGANTAAEIKCSGFRLTPGDYRVTVRYLAPKGDATITLKVNSKTRQFNCARTSKSVWGRKEYTFKCTKTTSFSITNTGGKEIYIDNVTFTPADQDDERFAINLRKAEHGSAQAILVSNDSILTDAYEGDNVRLEPLPDPGYNFVGWNIIHGRYFDIKDDGTFVMPNDQVTLEPIFVDASSIYSIDYSEVVAGALPAGWQTLDGTDVHAYPSTYGSGPRTMSGFTGAYPKALYWRTTSASYGRQAAYPLKLEPGKYRLSWAMATWKGTPQYKAQILTSTGSVLKETGYITATPNANGNGSADLSSAQSEEMEFEVKKAGNYIIQFQNNGSGFSEFLLAACRVNDLQAQGIESVVLDQEGTGAAATRIFDIEGHEISSLQPGMNIIVRHGQMVKRIYIK